MIQREDNPEYVNQFLDYTATILNKSPNTIKEYNYDIAMFLRFIKIHFKMTNETELDNIKFNDAIGALHGNCFVTFNHFAC